MRLRPPMVQKLDKGIERQRRRNDAEKKDCMFVFSGSKGIQFAISTLREDELCYQII